MIKIFGGSPEILEIMALFSSSHYLTPCSADVNLVRTETLKSFAIYHPYMVDYFHCNNIPKINRGALLLGLAKSIYYKTDRFHVAVRLFSQNVVRTNKWYTRRKPSVSLVFLLHFTSSVIYY